MGIPGLKICSAASADAAYGITKAMIRDNGPCFLFLPVKMMKEAKGCVIDTRDEDASLRRDDDAMTTRLAYLVSQVRPHRRVRAAQRGQAPPRRIRGGGE